MRVYDEIGNHVSSICIPEEGIDELNFEGNKEIIFNIPKIQLFPGNYTLSVHFDHIHNYYGSFNIEPALAFEVAASVIGRSSYAYERAHRVTRICSGAQIEGL